MIAVDADKLKGEIADMKATVQAPNWDYVTGYISALSVVEGMIATLPAITLDRVDCPVCEGNGEVIGNRVDNSELLEVSEND